VVKLEPESLAVVLATRNPFSNEAINYKDPEDRAFWYHQAAIHDLLVACREIRLPWTPRLYAEKGKNVRVGNRTPTHRAPGYTYPVLVEPEGEFSYHITVGQELPPGEYEVFFYMPTRNLSYPAGPVSERIAFDILGASR
jgi:hypothetical protein